MKFSMRAFVGLCLALIAGLVWMYPLIESRSIHAHEVPAIGGILARTNLQLCIANADGSPVKDEFMKQIETAFQAVKQHPQFNAAGLNSGAGPKLQAGCPSPSGLVNNEISSRSVNSAGSIQTYVFLMDFSDLSQVAFKHSPRVVGHEMMCTNEVCNSVANAIYLTYDEVMDAKTLQEALTAGIGLSVDDSRISTYTNGVSSDKGK